MRRPAALALLVIASASGASPASEPEESRNLLLNPGAESGQGGRPSIWVAAAGPARPDGPRMARTTERAHSGRASLAIAFDGPIDRPVAFNWAQTLAEAPVGRAIRLRAWIRTEGADSANVCVQCWDDEGEMLAFGSTPVFRGDQDWAEARSEPVVVPPRTARVMVRAASSGRGKAWFDDLAAFEDAAPSTDRPEASGPDSIKRLTGGRGEVFPAVSRAPIAPAYIKQRPVEASEAGPDWIDAALARTVGGRIIRALPIAKDCTILAYLPAWDHGRVDWIAVANNNGGSSGGVRALIGLPELKSEDVAPAGRMFVLALYSRKTTEGDGSSPIEAVELTSGWAESVSWDDAPDASPSPFASAALAPGEGWKLFDVTPLVRKWAGSGTRGRGLALRFAREDVGAGGRWSGYEFVSREGQAGRRPMLLTVEPAN